MDMKILAILAVIIVVGGGAAAYVVLSDDDDSDEFDKGAFNLVARVNSEGSGLYLKASAVQNPDETPLMRNDTEFFNSSTYAITEANKLAWGGLIVGTPGAASIQHTQMAEIAANAGLKFAQYVAGSSTNDDTLYYVTGLSNAGAIINDPDIQGGIIWEPQYQLVIDTVDKSSNKIYRPLALTNDLFDGHTCCVIAANHDWADDHSRAMTKFLAGYVEGVNYLKDAIAGDSEKYATVVAVAKEMTVAAKLSDEEVNAAIANITYLYADDELTGSLDGLTADISALATKLNSLGLTPNSKISNADEFADLFVDDDYLEDAVKGENLDKTKRDTIKVGVLSSDIHQIAVRIAIKLNYFDEYNLTVDLNTTASSGGEIATMLISRDINVGFLGAPPATLNTINGNHISV